MRLRIEIEVDACDLCKRKVASPQPSNFNWFVDKDTGVVLDKPTENTRLKIIVCRRCAASAIEEILIKKGILAGS